MFVGELSQSSYGEGVDQFTQEVTSKYVRKVLTVPPLFFRQWSTVHDFSVLYFVLLCGGVRLFVITKLQPPRRK